MALLPRVFPRAFDGAGLQTKILLVLVGVITPTFVIGTILQDRITKPFLNEEVGQNGMHVLQQLAKEIEARGWVYIPEPRRGELIERRVRELSYTQPSLARIEVFIRDPEKIWFEKVASSVEDSPVAFEARMVVPSQPRSFIVYDDDLDSEGWWIQVPLQPKGRRHPLGAVEGLASLRLVEVASAKLWGIRVVSMVIMLIALIGSLSYFLRRTIDNDRRRIRAERENVQLTEKLLQIEREVAELEKLALMGQLTARFAHEIGTPLNSISGHLELLEEAMGAEENRGRFAILRSQIDKIERIVQGFLQSTARPEPPRELVQLNSVAERALQIVEPRFDALDVEIESKLDPRLKPLRLVPIEVEQALLNLLNNSLDSLREKSQSLEHASGSLRLGLETRLKRFRGKSWVELSIRDTGMGISADKLSDVQKPFFTTKRPGQGTGLGLAICRELVRRHGGVLKIKSKQGSWTEVTLEFPYGSHAAEAS